MGCMACMYFFGLATSVCRHDYGQYRAKFRYLVASWPRNLARSFRLLIFAGMIYDDGAAYSDGPTRFSVHHALQVSTRKKRGLIAADVRRFGHAINTDEVFGTHTANFPRPAALRLLPTCETPAQQHARWRRRILLPDGAPCDRAYVATGALHTFERTLQHRRGCAR